MMRIQITGIIPTAMRSIIIITIPIKRYNDCFIFFASSNEMIGSLFDPDRCFSFNLPKISVARILTIRVIIKRISASPNNAL